MHATKSIEYTNTGKNCALCGSLFFADVGPVLVVSGGAKLSDESHGELLETLLAHLSSPQWAMVEPRDVCISAPSARLPVADIKHMRLWIHADGDGKSLVFAASDSEENAKISDAAAAIILIQSREVFRLRELSTTDPLTGLRNRRYLEAALREAIALSRRSAQKLALALIDIDDFKRFNTEYGYSAGDAVLIEFAARVLSSIRASDSLIRFGGDEFLLLMPLTDMTGAAIALGRVSNNLDHRPLENLPSSALGLRFSAGIVEFNPSEPVPSPSELIGIADARLRNAKKSRAGIVLSSVSAGNSRVSE